MRHFEVLRRAYEQRCIFYLSTWKYCAVMSHPCGGVDRDCDKYESRKDFAEFVERQRQDER